MRPCSRATSLGDLRPASSWAIVAVASLFGSTQDQRRAWNVTGWPTIYVMDHQGVIRFKNTRGEAMDKAVDQLLTEMGETPGKLEEDESGTK